MDLPVANEQMPTTTALKLLLLEDDPVSQAFLHEVLIALPARVDCVETCADAEALARSGAHALWLFDANLPDGGGAELLARLRAWGLTTPAIALTAESFGERLDALSAAGFSAVLQKPITAAALLAGLRRQLDGHALDKVAIADPSAVWNEYHALAAVGGKIESAQALRELFLVELPGQAESVRSAFAAADHATVRDHLHRLKAGCGFVGADLLLAAVNRLSAEMDAASLRHFLDTADLQRHPVTPGAA